MLLLWGYLTIINAVAFILMLLDKEKARQKKWRIKEATLIGVSVIGGSAGGLLGMYLFRHKTRHPKFTVGIPVILCIQLIAGFLIYTAIRT